SVTMEMGGQLADAAKSATTTEGAAAAGCPARASAPAAPAPAGCPAHASAPAATAAGDTAASTAALRVRIDRDLCQGHAVCASEAPEVFAISPKDQRVMLKTAHPPAELHDKVRNAARYCPNH